MTPALVWPAAADVAVTASCNFQLPKSDPPVKIAQLPPELSGVPGRACLNFMASEPGDVAVSTLQTFLYR